MKLKCLFLSALLAISLSTMASAVADSALVLQGERLAAKKETAQSLLQLNRYIDAVQEQPMSHGDSLLLLRAVNQNAQNYQLLGNTHQALAYFQRAIALAKSLGDSRRLASLYNNVFGIYYAQREYSQAEDLLRMSLAINRKANDSAAIRNNYNNFGLVSIDRGDFLRASSYMHQALDYTPKTDRIGRSLILTNLADLYSRQNQFAKAEQQLQQALALQQGIPMDGHTIQTSLNLAWLKAYRGRYAEAKRLQPSIYAALPRLPLAVQANSLAQLADIHFIMGDSIAALRDILRYQAIDDSLQRATNTSQLQQLLVAYDTERLRQTNSRLQQAVSMRTRAFVATVVFLVVLVALIGLLVRRMRIDKQKNRLISEQQARLLSYEQAEHERRQQELATEIDHKNRQLTTYTLDLASINEFHQHIASDLTALRQAAKDEELSRTLHDITLRLDHFNDKPLGDDFHVYFDEVHPGFLMKLSQNYNLSKADLRLCAYLFLGMTTKEIAALTHKEVRSVESQRNRLRKKLSLPAGGDFSGFFQSVIANN